MAIFNSYVKLPDGISLVDQTKSSFHWAPDPKMRPIFKIMATLRAWLGFVYRFSWLHKGSDWSVAGTKMATESQQQKEFNIL